MSKKRCHYKILGISKESSPEEIRSSYSRLALQRHSDKSLSEAEATVQFQELVHAYEVLSDPKERALYDFSNNAFACGWKYGGIPGGSIPDLHAFLSTTVYSGFSDKKRDGFYRVYFNVFKSVYLNEVRFARSLGLRLDSARKALSFRSLKRPYFKVRAFYKYWLGFCTVMDFSWVDEKVRKKAIREYNEAVRGLAEFVAKRDQRVIYKPVKKKYKEEDWALEEGGDDDDDDATRENEELYCIVCNKKFRSEKQWKNHEQSKKHKEKVAELIASFSDTEDEKELEDISGPLEPPETVEQLHEKFQKGLNIDNGEDNEKEVEDVKGSSEDEDVDEEMSLLNKMVSRLKNKRTNVVSKERNKHNTRKDMRDDAIKVQILGEYSSTDDNVTAMETTSKAVEEDSKKDDNRNSTGRRRRSKKSKDKNNLRDAEMEEYDSDKKSARSKKPKGRSKKTSSNECDRCGEDFESRTKLHKHLTNSGHATLKSRRSIAHF